MEQKLFTLQVYTENMQSQEEYKWSGFLSYSQH